MKSNALKIFATVPVAIVALVSHLALCPACWPFIGGLISALGVSSFVEGRFMLPLFAGSLLLAIAPLSYEARRRIGPFLLGLTAALLIVSGKFIFGQLAVTLSGLCLLAGAYAWGYRGRCDRKTAALDSTCAVPDSTAAGQAYNRAKTLKPIACTLDKAQFAERKVLLTRMSRQVVEHRSVLNGFAFGFRLEPNMVSQLAEFVELESACCPFLSFRIELNAGEIVWLELTGPEAAQRIIRELIPFAFL